MDQHNVQDTNPVENDHDVPSSTENDERDDPGAYPVPFRIPGKIVPGCRLDSIPDALRYWARGAERNTSPWYEDFLEADDRYETFLSERRAPGDYIVTFGKHKGKKLRELPVSYRYWAILPDRSSSGWYKSFVAENSRYEEHIMPKEEPGNFLFPCGEHKGTPLKDVDQNEVWRYLHPRHAHCHWYKALSDANRRYLDQYFSERSPGSVEIWFGQRYWGLRLDQAYQRRGFIAFCLDPRKEIARYYHRFRDLVHRYRARLQEYRAQSHPRRRRRAPLVENPCGEAIGPWDEDRGSADEDEEYEDDGFVCADDEFSDEDDQDDDDEVDQGSGYSSMAVDDSALQSADELAEDESSLCETDHPDAVDLEDVDDDTPLDVVERRLNAL
ncbi:hypothetical protein F5I97DRAFT_1122073 [Phlebopus sp. FC_14]|nr:hypothetical protein F5I97DRAFT_1122073 [Phlebopus sp. FC_14]